MPTITFQPVTQQNWRETLSLAVHPEQQRFISDYSPIALLGLAKAYIRPWGFIWLPYAIYADKRMVGFLELAFDPAQDRDFWIFHFFIDYRHQGQGHGKEALKLFVDHIRVNYPTCRNIRLTVHPDNHRAQQLYANAGFKPTGELAFGEPVYQLD